MYSLLFRNRWIAVGWVALTLTSAWTFAGKDGGADRITRSVEQFRARRAIVERPVVSPTVIVKRLPAAAPTAGPKLKALPGSTADPANPKAGDVFVNPLTGQRFRAVRRSDLKAGSPSDAPGADIPAAIGTDR